MRPGGLHLPPRRTDGRPRWQATATFSGATAAIAARGEQLEEAIGGGSVVGRASGWRRRATGCGPTAGCRPAYLRRSSPRASGRRSRSRRRCAAACSRASARRSRGARRSVTSSSLHGLHQSAPKSTSTGRRAARACASGGGLVGQPVQLDRPFGRQPVVVEAEQRHRTSATPSALAHPLQRTGRGSCVDGAQRDAGGDQRQHRQREQRARRR